MTTGVLAWMCLALGQQTASDVTYHNYRSHSIDVTYEEGKRGEAREVRLYASNDQGKTWELAETIPNTKNGFAFHTTRDGIYWLSVAMVNRQGKQEPDEKTIMTSPPHRKMVIDTVKPVVRSIGAQRGGDEVYVNWDIQEDNPARDGIKLEYQAKDSGGAWLPIPGTFTQNGQARFRPGNAATLAIRLTVTDLAGNQSFAFAEAAGTVARAGFSNPGGGIANPVANNVNTKIETPILPGGGLTVPGPMEAPKRVEPFGPGPAVAPPIRQPVEPKRVVDPVLSSGTTEVPASGSPLPPPTGFGKQPQPTGVARSPIAPPQPPPPAQPTGPVSKLAADSRTQASPIVQEPAYGTKRVANASPTRKPLPEIMYVNRHQVTLEYELKRVGPSGVGEVELWLTKDDGVNWEQYARDKDVQAAAITGRQKRTFDFIDLNTDQPFADGIYGLTLVVKNRAGVGREPRPGDAPEIRIEIDKEKPLAQLYEPIPDPQRPDHVLIMWNALDKNLIHDSINLEYAESRDGPWQSIAQDIANKGRYPGENRTGDHSWKVPANIPVQVFLRLRVRDRAGNEGVAVTNRPHYVDLIEPEGTLIGATTQPTPKRP